MREGEGGGGGGEGRGMREGEGEGRGGARGDFCIFLLQLLPPLKRQSHI